MKNIKENAKITLHSKRWQGAEKDEIKFTARGGFYERRGRFYLTYLEEKEAGMGDSRVLLKVEKATVTMRRMGEFKAVMEYKLNETTQFLYRVPFGELKLKIRTIEIENKLNENGGKLNFRYELIAGSDKTYNDITITVEPDSI